MTDERQPRGAAAEIDTGEPVVELADLRETPSRGFVSRVHNAIDRRELGGQMTDLAWNGPIVLVLELLDLVFRFLTGQKK